ncbi:MAG: CDGSH iron-sulfur domain-containing protein [Pseudomonadota bacterium]|nr:CDGSH iron-sulfur domain-containing protein [Pseudomonadota bacterium]
MPYQADKDQTLYFCGCKRSAGAPLCDGTHNSL